MLQGEMMSIKLEYLLWRNRQTFSNFCEREQIKSYEDLLEYCQLRQVEPFSQLEFNELITTEDLKKEKPEVKSPDEPKKTTKRKTTRKRTSTSKTRKNTKVWSDN